MKRTKPSGYGTARCGSVKRVLNMKAVRFHEYGEPDVLRYEDVEQPDPGAGEVRLRVAASAFNPVDDGIRGGYLRDVFPVTLPHTPGIEVAGTVDALGEGVNGVEVGDDVIGFLPMVAPGAAAEYAVAPAEILAPAPTSIPLADAAALPMVGLPAWQALFDDAGLTAGQRVLINGAGGAVGGYAVQLAKRAGPLRGRGRGHRPHHHRGDRGRAGRRPAQPRAHHPGGDGRVGRLRPAGRRRRQHGADDPHTGRRRA